MKRGGAIASPLRSLYSRQHHARHGHDLRLTPSTNHDADRYCNERNDGYGAGDEELAIARLDKQSLCCLGLAAIDIATLVTGIATLVVWVAAGNTRIAIGGF